MELFKRTIKKLRGERFQEDMSWKVVGSNLYAAKYNFEISIKLLAIGIWTLNNGEFYNVWIFCMRKYDKRTATLNEGDVELVNTPKLTAW